MALSARASLRRAHADGRPKQGEWIILPLALWLRGFSFFYFFIYASWLSAGLLALAAADFGVAGEIRRSGEIGRAHV